MPPAWHRCARLPRRTTSATGRGTGALAVFFLTAPDRGLRLLRLAECVPCRSSDSAAPSLLFVLSDDERPVHGHAVARYETFVSVFDKRPTDHSVCGCCTILGGRASSAVQTAAQEVVGVDACDD